MIRLVTLAVAALLTLTTAAQAATISIVEVTGANQGAKLAAKAALLAGLGSYTLLEDFESFAASKAVGHTTLSTGAGTFSSVGGLGTGGACIKPGGPSNATCDALYVLDQATTPFSGRFNSTAGGSQWLDSNDLTGIDLQLGSNLNTLFFFMTDVNDQGGRLKVKATDADGTATGVFGPGANGSAFGNGSLFFVLITSASGISNVQWINNHSGDGWGIDDISTLDTIPEPGLLALMGVAAGAAAWRRRSSRR